jgi:hypothetical protein
MQPASTQPADHQHSDHSDGNPTMMTIAMVDEVGTKRSATDAVTHLAGLAIADELVVVYGGTEIEPLVGQMRDQLPRHTVVVLYADTHQGTLRRVAGLLDELLELGSLPVVVTSAVTLADVAGELYLRLRADRMMKVAARPVRGYNVRSAA